MTDKFSFFRSFYDAIKDFPADDYKEAMNAILAYAFDEEDPEGLSLLAGTFFKLTKPNIDSSVKASESGKRGGAKHPSDNSANISKHPSGSSEKSAKHPSNDSDETAKHPSDNCASNKDKEYGIGNMDNGEGIGSKDNGSGRVDYKSVINAFNDTCVSFPRVTSLSEKRKAAIRARLRTHSMADIQEAFKKAEESDFLKGSNKRNWSANFDWIMNDANMAKILDGNYDNKSQEKTAAAPQNKFHNFNQREQDFSAIQTRLLQKQAVMTEDSG